MREHFRRESLDTHTLVYNSENECLVPLKGLNCITDGDEFNSSS